MRLGRPPHDGQAELERGRHRMVDRQIEARGVRDPRVLAAMRTVPRERFVPPELVGFAFDDGPLPIGMGQTISQPYIVALMSAALELRGDETVLEIGTGSGYAAAILGQLARRVLTVERRHWRRQRARNCGSSATKTSKSTTETAHSAGPSKRRSMVSWWPRRPRWCRTRSGLNWLRAGTLSSPSVPPTACRTCCARPAPTAIGSGATPSVPCASCRWSVRAASSRTSVKPPGENHL